MRYLQIAVPDGQRDAVVDVLREHQVGYTVTDGTGEQAGQTIVSFVVPADAVEHVLEDLEAVGFDPRRFTVSLETEFANFEHVDRVQNRWGNSRNRLAPQALRSKAKDLRRNTPSFLWMMVLSAIVATGGLLMRSPAVVVGSMVIAPIVSPVLTAGVGAVRDDRRMFLHSLHLQALGLLVAIATATLVGLVIKHLELVPVELAITQIELLALRLSPSILAIGIGLAAGAAGAYGLATKGDVTIVGVMIAAALIPTAAAVGIGIAWTDAVFAVGALLLLVTSMIAVNVGAVVMLYYLQYRPDHVDEGFLDAKTTWQAAVVGLTVVVALGTVLVAGGLFIQQSSFERSVNTAVTDTLDGEAYDGVDVVSVTPQYRSQVLAEEAVVTVTLARTTAEEFTDLANDLDRSIADRTGHDVVVEVRFIDYRRSDDGPA